MTIPLPFSDSFSLTPAPFNSRVSDQIDQIKNYYAVAFKPGYPLQASELNEIQEIFYVQQTLTQTMISNWMSAGVILGVNAVTGPGWDGCTPINPNLITYTAGTNTLTFGLGWYLIKKTNVNGGIGVWVYNNTIATISLVVAGDYGIIVEPITINCTSINPEPLNTDSSLQDQIGINVINGPCGAARLKLNVHAFSNINTVTTRYLCPILTVTAAAGVNTVTYKNNYKITIT